jgi:hypothetical protein
VQGLVHSTPLLHATGIHLLSCSVHGFFLQAGDHLNLEWERGRVFDQDVGQVFAAAVKDAGSLRVQSITTKEDRKPRPHGLNTVELLKVASSALNIGPAQAMAVRVCACVFSVALYLPCACADGCVTV